VNTSEDGKIRFTIENGELVGTPEVLEESASPEVKGCVGYAVLRATRRRTNGCGLRDPNSMMSPAAASR